MRAKHSLPVQPASSLRRLLVSTLGAGGRSWRVDTGRGALDEATIRRNIYHLVMEIAWYGILVGTTVNFLPVYVVRLGADSLLVGAITYGPALVQMLWQWSSADLINRSGQRMRWLMRTALLYRLGFLPIAALPLLMSQGHAELTVLILIAQAFPWTITLTGFQSLMADAVPRERLPQTLGWRMAAWGLSSTLSTLAAGPILARLSFPANYQVLFVAGFLASLVSQWHVSRVRAADPPPLPGNGTPWHQGFRRVLRYPGFARFAVAVGVLQMGLGMATPLLPLFWVRRLGASDQQISVVVTVFSALVVLGSLSMRQLVRRAGRARVLTAGAFGYALYPWLVSFSPGIWWLVPWAAIGGFFNAALSVALFDNLVAVTPAEDRTNCIAVYNVFVYAALFLGPLAAGLLAPGVSGPGLGLRVAAGLTALAGALFATREHLGGSEAKNAVA